MSANNRTGAPAHSEGNGGQPNAEVRPMKPGLEMDGKHPVGRDPRQMSRAELRALGHRPQSPLHAIRRHCLDCCGHHPSEVRKCAAVRCPSWPFRMGSNPWPDAPSAELREKRRQAAHLRWAREGEQEDAA
jgi:hypothetical protein